MEILKQKLELLVRALATLEAAVLKHEKSQDYDQERFEEYRDSLIQRFEYCTDLLWKVLKDYLEKVEKIKVASPRAVFRECHTIGLLTEQEADQFLTMLDARNMTSHVYREEFADLLYKQIPQFYAVMQALVSKVMHSKL